MSAPRGRRSAGKGASLLCALLFLAAGRAPAADWVLAATAFEFPQGTPASPSVQAMAVLLPQLVLEQVATGEARVPSEQEMAARALDSLQTERISLFLQLAKEVRVRDSQVVSARTPRSAKKKVAAAEKRIAELEGQIAQNLAATEQARHPEAAPPQETVALYKDDHTVLFVPPDDAREAGAESRAYERAVTAAHINGLLSGTITVYGGYASVTVSARTFPGGEFSATVTEVGSLDDGMALARNIVRALWPKLVNAVPVRLEFAISPDEAARMARVSIDGVVTALSDGAAVVPAGMHTVEVSCPGYRPRAVTYRFLDAPRFLVQVPLQEDREGTLSLSFTGAPDGAVYASGLFSGTVAAQADAVPVRINGAPVLGQFVAAGEEALSGFFYVPQALALDGVALEVRAEPQDTAALIEKRRIWMYRGYTALMLSLPLTFYAMGTYDAAYNGYTAGRVSAAEVNSRAALRLGAAGISLVAGGFFIFELVRYLHAASSVLPAQAHAQKNQPGLAPDAGGGE